MFSNVLAQASLAPASGSNEPADGPGVRPGTRQGTRHARAAVAAAAMNKFHPSFQRMWSAVGNMHTQVVETQRVVHAHDQRLNAHEQRLASLEQHTCATGMRSDSDNARFIKGELGKRGRAPFIDQTAADDLLKSNRFKGLRGLKMVAKRADIPYAENLQ